MIKVTYQCGGCFDEAPGKTWPKRIFQGFNGKDYGWGTYKYDDFQSIAPDGWVAFDPYTGCTYCPDCWAEIETGVSEDVIND